MKKLKKNELFEVKEIIEKLICILKKEGKGQMNYYIRELEYGSSLIEEYLLNPSKKTETELKKMIRELYPSHGGLSDFYIWREDGNERVAINKPISEMGDRLWKILI